MNMNFGMALEVAKTGNKIARSGWNGKNMFVCYMPPMELPEASVNERTKKFVPDGDLKVGGYFVMFTADKTWQPGWLASQSDLLAEDWEIVD